MTIQDWIDMLEQLKSDHDEFDENTEVEISIYDEEGPDVYIQRGSEVIELDQVNATPYDPYFIHEKTYMLSIALEDNQRG